MSNHPVKYIYIYKTNAKQNRNDNKKIKNFFPVILKIDDNLETVFDFKSLKTDIRNNINKIIDKLKGVQKDNSDKEKVDPKKIINDLKDLF